MRCVDLGCGGGEVTLEMARLVAPGGSVTGVDEAKTLPWSTLEATAETIVSEHVASADEVTAALSSLQQFTAARRTLISGPRVFQLWSRR